MAIIDSQVHAYEANTPKRPWHTVPNWPDHEPDSVSRAFSQRNARCGPSDWSLRLQFFAHCESPATAS
jgi:hypothetical protein